MTDIQVWLDKGREIESKATDGPWGGTWNGAREGNIGGETEVLDAMNVSSQDLYFITEARTRFPQALTALQAVLDLHKPFEWSFGYEPVTSCRECAETGKTEANAEYPCPTVRAIQDTIGEDR